MQADHKTYVLHRSITELNAHSSTTSVIREIGAASTVLLKNTDGALPLAAPKSIAVVGNGAGNNSMGINGYVRFARQLTDILN